jgi:hypothetical protein
MAESDGWTVPEVAGAGAHQDVRLARPSRRARWLPEEVVDRRRGQPRGPPIGLK